jgi:hypothetical protein
MKKVLMVLALFVSFAVKADVQEDVMNAFRAGNAKTLASYFTPSIELNLPGTEGMFSKAQAEGILKDFFAKNQCKSLSMVHQGTSKDGAKYSIANLQTNTGNFRVYFFLKKEGDSFLVKELRIESEK